MLLLDATGGSDSVPRGLRRPDPGHLNLPRGAAHCGALDCDHCGTTGWSAGPAIPQPSSAVPPLDHSFPVRSRGMRPDPHLRVVSVHALGRRGRVWAVQRADGGVLLRPEQPRDVPVGDGDVRRDVRPQFRCEYRAIHHLVGVGCDGLRADVDRDHVFEPLGSVPADAECQAHCGGQQAKGKGGGGVAEFGRLPYSVILRVEVTPGSKLMAVDTRDAVSYVLAYSGAHAVSGVFVWNDILFPHLRFCLSCLVSAFNDDFTWNLQQVDRNTPPRHPTPLPEDDSSGATGSVMCDLCLGGWTRLWVMILVLCSVFVLASCVLDRQRLVIPEISPL